MDGQHVGEAIVGALVVVKQVADVFSGRRREQSLRLVLSEFKLSLEDRLTGFDRRIDKLFAFVIGPDGENGIRGDLRELTGNVRDIERRERERTDGRDPRDARDAARPVYDRRSGT